MTKILIDEAVARQTLEALFGLYAVAGVPLEQINKKLLLEALDEASPAYWALRQALEQPAPAGYAKKIESLIAERDALKAKLAEQPAPAQPLTDEQCDAIYNALDEWSREVDAYDFGLPAVAGGGIEKGREIIKTAHGITKVTP